MYTAMNLHTFAIKTMKMRQNPADLKQNEFIDTLTKIHREVTNLLEDPLFIDSIHGEQEMGLDLTLELIDNIIDRIRPQDMAAFEELMSGLDRTAVDIT